MNAILKLLSIVTLILLIGCAHLNEGCNDYRKADAGVKQADPTANASKKPVSQVNVTQASPGGTAGDPHSALLKKYARAADPFRRLQKNDTISVHLQQAYIKDFHETSFFTTDEHVRGEIAIVIKVFELTDGKDFNFSPKAAEDGRIVFYSDDVRKGQFLNFSAMPVYGPITYQGNPLALDIFIIELDSTDERTKNMLHTLASVGGTAYPPASPILKILDTMGTSLLKGDKNDVEFRYSMALYPDKGYRTLDQAVLEVGNYVFIKQTERDKSITWEELTLDEKSGRLHNKDSSEYRDKTYFVVQINKGYDATTLDLSQNTFRKLLTAVDQQQKADAAVYKAAIDGAMAEYLKLQASTKKFSDLRQTLTEIEATPGNQSNRKRSLSADLVSRIAEEIGRKAPADLSTEQIDYLLDNLKRLVVADSGLYAGINRTNLQDAAFRTKVIDTISRGAATGP